MTWLFLIVAPIAIGTVATIVFDALNVPRSQRIIACICLGVLTGLLVSIDRADAALACGVQPIAHRGHHGVDSGKDENTVEAIRAAHWQIPGGASVEIDARPTRDGVLALMHDANVKRTTSGQGIIGYLSWAYVNGLLTEPRGQRVPTLAEAIATAKAYGLSVVIEAKSGAMRDAWTAQTVRDLTKVVTDAGYAHKVWIHAQTDDVQEWLYQYARPLHIAWRPTGQEPYGVAAARAQGEEVQAVMLSHWRTTRELVDAYHRAGYQVWTRTGTYTEGDWSAEATAGVDRLLTDTPEAFAGWCGR